jgi:hypothetical protein
LNEIAAQVNVLDAPVREMDLMSKENSPTHRHAVVFKFVSQRFVLEKKRQEHHDDARAREQRNQTVVFKERAIGPLEFAWIEIVHGARLSVFAPKNRGNWVTSRICDKSGAFPTMGKTLRRRSSLRATGLYALIPGEDISKK